jgi:4-hydroxybenzoate polyprenyltransferase
MMFDESLYLWKHIIKESIWGNRGLLKISSLFLPVSVLLTLNEYEIRHESVTAFFQISLVVACWLFFSVLINDIADSQDDRITGKLRWINRFSLVFHALIFVLLLVIGLGTLVLSRSPHSTVWVFVFAVVTGISYSFKPLRLKERGIWGLCSYSLACTLGYCVIPWTWLTGSWHLLFLLAPAIFLDKWVNLHFHQIVDYESDFETGTKTFAVSSGLENARRSLTWISLLASLWLFIVFFYVAFKLPTWRATVFLAGVVTFLACGLYIFMAKRSSKNATHLVRELSWFYLGISYAVLRILPLVLFVLLSLEEPSTWYAVAFLAAILIAESWLLLRYQFE